MRRRGFCHSSVHSQEALLYIRALAVTLSGGKKQSSHISDAFWHLALKKSVDVMLAWVAIDFLHNKTLVGKVIADRLNSVILQRKKNK